MDEDKIQALLEKALSENKIDNLINKAINNSTGFSTRQSLDNKVTDVTQRKTPLFDIMLDRADVVNPIHDWDSKTENGAQASYAGPIDSTGVDTDPRISRYNEAVKYYTTTTTTGQFTDAMSRSQLPAQATNDANAVDALKQDIEADIIQGSNIAGRFHMRGMDNVIRSFAASSNVIDNGGTLSDTTNVKIIIKNVHEAGGAVDTALLGAEDVLAFNEIYENSVRTSSTIRTMIQGYTLTDFATPFSTAKIVYDQFVNPKTGSPATSNIYMLQIDTWKLGEPMVNGTKGIGVQDLAKTGPASTKLFTYYGLLMYNAPQWNGILEGIE